MRAERSFPDTPDNLSMPAATVIPVLSYPDVRAAADWLCMNFGFTERLRIGSHRIQLNVGHGAIVIAQGPNTNEKSEGVRYSVMVRVTNADRHYAKALRAGAKVVADPTSFPYGGRQYTVVDFAGHVWTFSQSESNVDPAQRGGQLVG